MRNVSAVRTSSAENGSSIRSSDRIRDDRACEADPLAHAAGELAWIGGLEAVEPDEVDGRHRAAARLGARQPQRIEAELHILQHGEPGIESEGLEHDGDTLRRARAAARRDRAPHRRSAG